MMDLVQEADIEGKLRQVSEGSNPKLAGSNGTSDLFSKADIVVANHGDRPSTRPSQCFVGASPIT
jgi:hypothetical protein